MAPLSENSNHNEALDGALDDALDGALDEELLETSLVAARDIVAFQRPKAGSRRPGDPVGAAERSLVALVDLQSANIVVDRVRKRFPHHIIMAEDDLGAMATESGEGERVMWIINPLDGTLNWLQGYPSYGVSIATLDSRGLRTAVVMNSASGEEFAARRGGGATCDGLPIRVSAVSDPGLALLGSNFPFEQEELMARSMVVMGAMLATARGVRRKGAVSLDLCDLAAGRLDACWRHWLQPWEVAGGALIVREAGGTCGPLPATPDPELQAIVRGAGQITRAFAGDGALTLYDRGAFLAGNGLLEPPLRELWTQATRDAMEPSGRTLR